MEHRCIVCHRILKDEKSIELGMGTTCYKRIHNIKDNPFVRKRRCKIGTDLWSEEDRLF